MAITISNSDRNYIYGIIGAPNISITDTGLMTDQIADDMVIEPSLREYFRWFAIEKIVNTQISSGDAGTIIPFPDDEAEIFTYDLLDCRLAHLQDTNNIYNVNNITNPIVQFRNIGMSRGGRLGSKYDYGFRENIASTEFTNDSMSNLNQVFYNKVDYINKTVKVFSQNPGTVQTTFACYSTNVDHVRYTSKREFLDLCRGELLLFWANNLKRINPEFPVAFNIDDLVTDGQDLKDLTIKKWQGKSKAVIMRN